MPRWLTVPVLLDEEFRLPVIADPVVLDLIEQIRRTFRVLLR